MFRKLKEIQGHAGAIYTCAFDGQFLYTGSADKFVTRWDLQLGTQDKFAIRFEQSVYAIEIADNLLFVGLANGALHVFDLEKRVELKHFVQHTEAIFSISFDPIKNRVYVGDATGNFSVWDASSLELIIYLPLNAGKIRNIALQVDEVALACQDGTVRIFESNFYNEIKTLEAHENGATAVHFNGKELISGGKDALIKSWDLESETVLKEIPAHNFVVYQLLQLQEDIISISRDKTIKIFDGQLNFKQRLDLKEGGHRHSINDGVLLGEASFASVGDDKRIIVWTKEDV